VAPTGGGGGGGLFSKQSLVILMLGIMFGYLLLPVLLVQHLGFDDVAIKPGNIQINGVNAIGTLKPANKEYKVASQSRYLQNDEDEEEEEEKQPPELPDEEGEEGGVRSEEEAGERNKAEKKNEDLKAEEPKKKPEEPKKQPEEPKVVETKREELIMKETVPLINLPILNAAEQRIVEDRDILAKQSIPTATSPHIMKTNFLPDHHRKKILVTGGAGFVGSHLVDKLMMEGHEVIVVDNFFTGQKKNIAHWLHHPNFR
jgi:hypothetical protein